MALQLDGTQGIQEKVNKGHFQQVKNENQLGFHQLGSRDRDWDLAIETAAKLKTAGYEKLIVIGMGGSSLGGKTLVETVSQNPKAVEFWNSLDPFTLTKQIQSINDFESTHWLIVSKSGGTLETLTIANQVFSQYEKSGKNFYKHCTVITENKRSPLKDFASKNNVPCLEHYVDVGGRFSAFTIVGLLPAAFAGVDIQELRSGVQWADTYPEQAIQFANEALESFSQKRFVTVFWPYCDRLESFCAWLVQLWAESLGKEYDRKSEEAPGASFPSYCLGSRDQHSILQQLADGQKDKLITFFEVNDFSCKERIEKTFFDDGGLTLRWSLEDIYQAQCHSTIEALKEKGAQVAKWSLSEVSAYNIGALMYHMEMVIALIGEAHNINAFDQPGVELGKQLTIKKLSQKS